MLLLPYGAPVAELSLDCTGDLRLAQHGEWVAGSSTHLAVPTCSYWLNLVVQMKVSDSQLLPTTWSFADNLAIRFLYCIMQDLLFSKKNPQLTKIFLLTINHHTGLRYLRSFNVEVALPFIDRILHENFCHKKIYRIFHEKNNPANKNKGHSDTIISSTDYPCVRFQLVMGVPHPFQIQWMLGAIGDPPSSPASAKQWPAASAVPSIRHAWYLQFWRGLAEDSSKTFQNLV